MSTTKTSGGNGNVGEAEVAANESKPATLEEFLAENKRRTREQMKARVEEIAEAKRIVAERKEVAEESVIVGAGSGADQSVTAAEPVTAADGSTKPNVTDDTDVTGLRDAGSEEEVKLVHETTERGTRIPFVTITRERYRELREDTAKLLDFARGYIGRFAWLSESEHYDMLALWVLHTWAFEAAETTPYLHVTAPEREAGKSRVLEVLRVLVRNGWKVGGTTAASLYRKIDAEYVTLLLDEGDNLYARGQEYVAAVNGILNDGYRRGGVYSLAVPSGNDYVQRDFQVFCPKAIAGIGFLPDTVASRSVRLDMKRARGKVESFMLESEREESVQEFLRYVQHEWAPQVVPILSGAQISRLEGLGDRAFDCWRPLLAIASFASPSWTTRAEKAAVLLSGPEATRTREESLGVILLRDCKEIFERDKAKALSSERLRLRLTRNQESPWYDFKGRGPISLKLIADILESYGVRPEREPIRFTLELSPKEEEHRARGYYRHAFEEAWETWL
jgi:hypothetical protein